MLPLFSRSPGLPGPRQTLFSGRLLAVASFLLLVIGWVVLAFPATASAHASPPHVSVSTPCLQVSILNFDPYHPGGHPNGPNTATFGFSIRNTCRFDVTGIRVSFKVEPLDCNEAEGWAGVIAHIRQYYFVNSGVVVGSFAVPGPLAGLGTKATALTGHRACILCDHGKMAFPHYRLLVQILAVTGVNASNPAQQVTLLSGNDSELESVAPLSNAAHDPDGLHC